MFIIKEILEKYQENFKVSLIFGLLLVFVLFFNFVSSSFLTSGSIFLDYNFLSAALQETILLAILFVVLLLFYAVCITSIVLAIRREYSHLNLRLYVREKLRLYALRFFVFLLAFTLAILILNTVLTSLGVSAIFVNVIALIVALMTAFLPQTLVIDELELDRALPKAVNFALKHPQVLLMYIVSGTTFVFLMPLIEYGVDIFFPVGNYVSLILSLLVVLPLLEILKTIVYLHKFDLIKLSFETHKIRDVKPKQRFAHH